MPVFVTILTFIGNAYSAGIQSKKVNVKKKRENEKLSFSLSFNGLFVFAGVQC